MKHGFVVRGFGWLILRRRARAAVQNAGKSIYPATLPPTPFDSVAPGAAPVGSGWHEHGVRVAEQIAQGMMQAEVQPHDGEFPHDHGADLD